MAKPTNTIGDRDFGRRTYTSKKTYNEQRRLTSDAHIDRTRQRKHSEWKKPYIPDLGYPEMEGTDIPWDPPNWPQLPPDNPTTTTPNDPGGPLPPRPPPDRPIPPFLGCNFFSRRITPRSLLPGQIAYGGVDTGSQDSIAAIHIYGPGILGTDISGCNESYSYKSKGYKAENIGKGFCGISVKAKDNPKDFNHVTPYFVIGKDSNGPFPIVVEVIMLSGAICTENLEVTMCPVSPPLAWNELSSPETIAASDQVAVFISGGMAPYSWSVSGTGFHLTSPKTDGLTNILWTDATACGTGTITVTDSCGTVVQGYLRAISGIWITEGVDQSSCPNPGPSTSGPAGSDSTCSSGLFERIARKWRTWHCYTTAPAASVNFEPCGTKSVACDCGASYCHPIYGCNGMSCISITEWQYMGAFSDKGGQCGGMGAQDGCYCHGLRYHTVAEWSCP